MMEFRTAKIKTNTMLYFYIYKASASNYFCPYAAIFYSSITENFFFPYKNIGLLFYIFF